MSFFLTSIYVFYQIILLSTNLLKNTMVFSDLNVKLNAFKITIVHHV